MLRLVRGKEAEDLLLVDIQGSLEEGDSKFVSYLAGEGGVEVVVLEEGGEENIEGRVLGAKGIEEDVTLVVVAEAEERDIKAFLKI